MASEPLCVQDLVGTPPRKNLGMAGASLLGDIWLHLIAHEVTRVFDKPEQATLQKVLGLVAENGRSELQEMFPAPY